jgi:hypothetical protein
MTLNALTYGSRNAAFASSSPTPLNFLTNVALWLRPDPAYVTKSGADVSALINRGALGNATGVNSPQWTAIDADFNGHPSISGNGTTNDRRFTLPNLSSLTVGEVFIVAKVNADPPGAAADSGFWKIGSVGGAGTHVPFTDGVIYDEFGSTAQKTVGDAAASLTSTFHYNVLSKDGEWTARLNGVQIFTTGTNTVGFSATPVLMGSSADNIWLNGKWADFVLCSSEQTAAARAAWANYVARYGL